MAAVSNPQSNKTESQLQLKLNEDLKQAMQKGDTVRRSILRLLISSIRYTEMAKAEAEVNSLIKKAEAVKHASLTEDETNELLQKAGIVKHAPLTEDEIIGVIQKEVKKHRESIEAFKQGKRTDLVNQEEAELAVLTSYLPEQMGRDEIMAEARRVIAEVGAKGPADKSKVMPKLMALLRGKADGRVINEVVTELLR